MYSGHGSGTSRLISLYLQAVTFNKQQSVQGHCIKPRTLSSLVSCSQGIVGDGWTIVAMSAIMWLLLCSVVLNREPNLLVSLRSSLQFIWIIQEQTSAED